MFQGTCLISVECFIRSFQVQECFRYTFMRWAETISEQHYSGQSFQITHSSYFRWSGNVLLKISSPAFIVLHCPDKLICQVYKNLFMHYNRDMVCNIHYIIQGEGGAVEKEVVRKPGKFWSGVLLCERRRNYIILIQEALFIFVHSKAR